jgi:hypothetical protein
MYLVVRRDMARRLSNNSSITRVMLRRVRLLLRMTRRIIGIIKGFVVHM